MDLTVSSYKVQPNAFKGFVNPSARRICQAARDAKLAEALNNAAKQGVSGEKLYSGILNRYGAAVAKLNAFVEKLHPRIGITSGGGTDAVFKFVYYDSKGTLVPIPTTDLFEKAAVKDSFEAIEYVADTLATKFKPENVEKEILRRIVLAPAVVDGRQITLRPMNVVLQAAKKFAEETNNMPLYNELEAEVTKRPSAFKNEYNLLQQILKQ